jgi:hypothetical protein
VESTSVSKVDKSPQKYWRQISEFLITTTGRKLNLIFEFEHLGLILWTVGRVSTMAHPVLKILQ